jgi:DNA-binding transcriptional regulator GbsR (MarR family)
MTEKMTYTKALESVLSMELTAEVREKLEALKTQLEKRSASKSTKPTKAQREAAEFTESVYTALAGHAEPMRCGDLATELGVSGQKVSAALSKLVKAGTVVKTEGEKHVSMFAVAPVEAAGDVE